MLCYYTCALGELWRIKLKNVDFYTFLWVKIRSMGGEISIAVGEFSFGLGGFSLGPGGFSLGLGDFSFGFREFSFGLALNRKIRSIESLFCGYESSFNACESSFFP